MLRLSTDYVLFQFYFIIIYLVTSGLRDATHCIMRDLLLQWPRCFPSCGPVGLVAPRHVGFVT